MPLTSTILVHEPTSLWTAEMERQLRPEYTVGIRWRPDFRDLLEEASRSSLVVLTANPGEGDLAKLAALLRRTAGIVCLLSGESSDWEWQARELGADVVLPDTSPKSLVIRSIINLLPRMPAVD